MQKLIKAVRLSLIYTAALLLTAGYPLSAMAETMDTPAPSAATTTTAPETTQSTPVSEPAATTPPAQSSDTAAATVPSSTSTASSEPTKPKETYTYNAETGRWDSNNWQYNPETGKYERPPAPVVAQSNPQTASTPVIVEPSTAASSGEKNTSSAQQTTNAAIDDTTKNAITNAINSGALSGDATVKNNTKAGNATTGDASAVATIINNVNSTVTNDSNQKAATFVSNVMGDVHGDIILQPMLLKAMLEAGAQQSPQGSTSVTTTNQLVNDTNLDARSGNATVAGNTQAGSATSGDANAVANVLNIVNSMISANRSFVGTINIYGSLDGDILIAPDFIPQMIANNGTKESSASPSSISSKDTQSIVNNIALAAETGKAVVAGNTQAGNATTGDADTNIVLFNLSGHEIIASNSLLVFVNVLGKWVGVIVDAPTGATAAAIGSGVATNTAASPDLVVDVATNTQLINNINLTALSGDATVRNNTKAGNATSGNATASANIGNIVGTRMGLSDWFGILFINVFGSWDGSFGIDTLSGNRPAVASGGQGSSPRDSGQPMHVIQFVPRSHTPAGRFSNPAITIIGSSGNGDFSATAINDQPKVRLASAATKSDDNGKDIFSALSPVRLRPQPQQPWLSGSLVLAGLTLFGASIVTDAKKRQAQLR